MRLKHTCTRTHRIEHRLPRLACSVGSGSGGTSLLSFHSRASPSLRSLLRESHAIFVDLHGRLAAASSPATRAATLLAASQRYRTATGRAVLELERLADDLWCEIEGSTNAEQQQQRAQDAGSEAEALKVVNAIWHALEVGYLRDEVTAAQGLLEWLRTNFMDPVSDALLSRMLDRLRTPAAASDPAIATDAWDVVTKLALEGQPREAGKLLQLLATLRREPEVAELATLLVSYPIFDAAACENRGAYATAWTAWHTRVVAARRAGVGVGYGPTAADALMTVICGGREGAPSSFGAALRACAPRGSLVSDSLSSGDASGEDAYSRWYHFALASLLYRQPPSAVPRTHFGSIVRTAMREAGEAVNASASGFPHDDDDGGGEDGLTSDPSAQLLGGFVAVFCGNPGEPLRLLCGYGQVWAAAHLADLLWAGGLLSRPTLLCPPWGAPTRAHLLLEHALALPGLDAGMWRQGLSYASAATPESTASSCGSGARGRKPAAPASAAAAAASAVAAAEELAVLSGSCAASRTVATFLLRCAPLSSARDACKVAALAIRYGLSEGAEEAQARWLRLCVDGADTLGTALAEILRVAAGDSSLTERARLSVALVSSALERRLLRLLTGAMQTVLLAAAPSSNDTASASANDSLRSQSRAVLSSSSLRDADAAWLAAGLPMGAVQQCVLVAAAVADEGDAQEEDAAAAAPHFRVLCRSLPRLARTTALWGFIHAMLEFAEMLPGQQQQQLRRVVAEGAAGILHVLLDPPPRHSFLRAPRRLSLVCIRFSAALGLFDEHVFNFAQLRALQAVLSDASEGPCESDEEEDRGDAGFDSAASTESADSSSKQIFALRMMVSDALAVRYTTE